MVSNSIPALGQRRHFSRTRLRAQVALEKFASAGAICVVHNVVTVEDPPRLVAAQFHGHALRNSGAHHVSDRRPAQIVNNDSGESRLLARRLPGLPEVADRLAVVVEHVRAIRTPLLVRSLDDFQKLAAERKRAAVFVFADLGAKTELAAGEIDV